MVFVKIVLVVAAAAVLMVVARDRHWAQQVGVTGSCAQVQPPTGQPRAIWYACEEGVMTGRPNLESQGCTSAGLVAHDELWQCRAPLVSLPGY